MSNSEEQDRIDREKQITMHFTLSLESGEVVDSTSEDAPATFVFGDGNLLPGFEESLIGLKAGDKRSVVVAPENGFGPHRDENIQKFRKELFKRIVDSEEMTPGLVVNFTDASNAAMPGVIQAIEDDYVVVDFNHPLAGKLLNFHVEILDVGLPVKAVKMVGE